MKNWIPGSRKRRLMNKGVLIKKRDWNFITLTFCTKKKCSDA